MCPSLQQQESHQCVVVVVVIFTLKKRSSLFSVPANIGTGPSDADMESTVDNRSKRVRSRDSLTEGPNVADEVRGHTKVEGPRQEEDAVDQLRERHPLGPRRRLAAAETAV